MYLNPKHVKCWVQANLSIQMLKKEGPSGPWTLETACDKSLQNIFCLSLEYLPTVPV